MTIKETLDQGINRLSSGRIENPAVTCELLLVAVLKCQRVDLYLSPAQSLTEKQMALYQGMLEERISGRPVQYITHSASFFGLELYVDENVLIPRPETEILVEAVLERLSESKFPVKIIDWGTGSGNVAIALASHLQGEVFAIDISKGALEVALKNIASHGLESRIKLLRGDGFKAVPKDLKGKMDGVVSNPPYVRRDEEDSLPREVRDFEPKEALFDKEQGLYFTEKIVSEAEGFLKKDGLLVLEIALGQAEKVTKLIHQEKSYRDIEIMTDLAGTQRVVLARRK
ncbi:MAG: protein-(glutamine-N5) methyltransferase, release factor-specific [candidate division Zixibacteria bacterium RBG_16_50_21]|nr:MAG: protein-(glutamine-N5) methyltransferase, release factor-specific [candidate division Zixibacteria bacterium RBG_16_50_21]